MFEEEMAGIAHTDAAGSFYYDWEGDDEDYDAAGFEETGMPERPDWQDGSGAHYGSRFPYSGPTSLMGSGPFPAPHACGSQSLPAGLARPSTGQHIQQPAAGSTIILTQNRGIMQPALYGQSDIGRLQAVRETSIAAAYGSLDQNHISAVGREQSMPSQPRYDSPLHELAHVGSVVFSQPFYKAIIDQALEEGVKFPMTSIPQRPGPLRSRTMLPQSAGQALAQPHHIAQGFVQQPPPTAAQPASGFVLALPSQPPANVATQAAAAHGSRTARLRPSQRLPMHLAVQTLTTATGVTRISGQSPEFDEQHAPPEWAALPACPVSAAELVYFCPVHTKYPRTMLRLRGNGWTTMQIAAAQLEGRGLLNDPELHRRSAAVRQQTLAAGRAEYSNEDWTVQKNGTPATNVYDVSPHTPRPSSNVTVKPFSLTTILAMAHQMPHPEDQGIFTQVLLFAQRNPHLNLTTADVPRVAAQEGYVLPAGATTATWDQDCKRRILDRLRATGHQIPG